MLKSTVIFCLRSFQPANERERLIQGRIVLFAEENPRPWSRKELGGHLTASAWVTNADASRALLLHHAKLGRWLQPGGHIEESDPDLTAAALREAREETGLTSLHLVKEAPFDLDIHPIPIRGEEPEHFHYDCRFLMTADEQEPLAGGLSDLKWIDIEDIEGGPFDEGIKRMARKSKNPG